MRLTLFAPLIVVFFAAVGSAREHGVCRDEGCEPVAQCDADGNCGGDRNTDPACGTCSIVQESTGCSVQSIEDCVCGIDDFCCGNHDGFWDAACVALVHEECGGEYCFIDAEQECAGTCGTANYGYGCSVPEVEECVCAYDPWCCETQWDAQCVEEAWHSPCYTDCDCQGENLYGGVDLPPFWSNLGTDYGLNETHLGFNPATGKWCYSYSNTCIRWGEWDEACDDSTYACAGGESNGYGDEQMAMLAEMESMGLRRHFACPDCFDKNPCESGAMPGTNNGPIYTDCECFTHFIGEPVLENGYWWNQAQTAGLDSEHLSFFDNQWYYHDIATCVAKGSYAGICDSVGSSRVCAGVGGSTFGAASDQMAAVLAADSNGGSHPTCPVLGASL